MCTWLSQMTHRFNQQHQMAIDHAQDNQTFESLLSKLTLEEKVTLLSGYRFNAAPGILRLHVGIPPIKVSHIKPLPKEQTSK